MSSKPMTVISAVLAAAVATNGTFTATYPVPYTGSDYRTLGHKLSILNFGDYEAPKDMTIAFGAATATVTWKNATSIPANSQIFLELALKGDRDYRDSQDVGAGLNPGRCSNLQLRELNLGNPVVAATTAVTTAQLLAGAGALALDGTLVTGGVAVFDVPRNVTLTVATTDQSAVHFAVTGLDEYGNVMKETITGPNANTVQGLKAFAKVTGVVADAAVATNGVSVGSGNKLGLPVFVSNSVFVLKELQDGAAPSAGTIVAGSASTQTATTGDVRGTYLPNATPDGAKAFGLVVALQRPDFKGGAQFAG